MRINLPSRYFVAPISNKGDWESPSITNAKVLRFIISKLAIIERMSNARSHTKFLQYLTPFFIFTCSLRVAG